jgi:hypothetical protein
MSVPCSKLETRAEPEIIVLSNYSSLIYFAGDVQDDQGNNQYGNEAWHTELACQLGMDGLYSHILWLNWTRVRFFISKHGEY